MKRAQAKWIAENPESYGQGIRSFWLNAFVSQWASWESIVLKYLNALGSTKKMQVVFNTCFGEPWEDRGDIEDEDSESPFLCDSDKPADIHQSAVLQP